MAWVTAHTIKFIIGYIKKEEQTIKTLLFISGGMPSGHSATVIAMTTIIGLRDGFGSGLFGIAVLLSTIVMYDAVKVRRSSGEQGLALRQLIRESGSNIELPRAAKGHNPLEVLLGAILGLLIGIVVYFATI